VADQAARCADCGKPLRLDRTSPTSTVAAYTEELDPRTKRLLYWCRACFEGRERAIRDSPAAAAC
jgi:hypothetical protein